MEEMLYYWRNGMKSLVLSRELKNITESMPMVYIKSAMI
jgi:hypothetical protein